MARTYTGPIYDGDGHVLENKEAIIDADAGRPPGQPRGGRGCAGAGTSSRSWTTITIC